MHTVIDILMGGRGYVGVPGAIAAALTAAAALIVARRRLGLSRLEMALALPLVASLTLWASVKPPPPPGPPPGPELGEYARIYARPMGPATNGVQRLQPTGRLERR